MKPSRTAKVLARCAGTAAALAAATYAAYVAVTWLRYGRPRASAAHDDLLERFMPEFDVIERHRVRIPAPASVTMVAARRMDLLHVPLIRLIFRAREVLLRATPVASPPSRGIVADTEAMGWRVLADVADREVVVGAVTRPWEPNVTFRPIEPDRFAAFAEPDYVKIVWTLRADPIDASSSWFSTETRAVATDREAARKFRRYWALLSPGIILIRWLSLGPLKRDAERQARLAAMD